VTNIAELVGPLNPVTLAHSFYSFATVTNIAELVGRDIRTPRMRCRTPRSPVASGVRPVSVRPPSGAAGLRSGLPLGVARLRSTPTGLWLRADRGPPRRRVRERHASPQLSQATPPPQSTHLPSRFARSRARSRPFAPGTCGSGSLIPRAVIQRRPFGRVGSLCSPPASGTAPSARHRTQKGY